MCPCRHTDPSSSPVASSTPTGQPQRKPVWEMCHACSGVLPAVIDWQIVDLAVIRRWRLVDRHPSGTGKLVRADSCTAWRRACTWLSLARQASAAWCAGAGTNLGQTSSYRWPHALQRSSFVAPCRSSLSMRTSQERCSSQRVTTRRRGRVWLTKGRRVATMQSNFLPPKMAYIFFTSSL